MLTGRICRATEPGDRRSPPTWQRPACSCRSCTAPARYDSYVKDGGLFLTVSTAPALRPFHLTSQKRTLAPSAPGHHLWHVSCKVLFIVW